MNTPLFSIIIANYNKQENISPLLSSIFSNYPYDDFEVIFLDDASTDNSAREAGLFPVQLHVGERNAGPATLRNIGASKARGEYLLFMDSDVILLPQTLLLFRDICKTGGFGALLGMEALPPVIENWVGNFRTLQIQDYWGKYRCRQAFLGAWGATFGAVRKDVFLKYGGFNESFRGADVEDYELGIKIMGENDILFAPQLAYRHSYTSFSELMVKQFKRAAQIVNLDSHGHVKHSYYGIKFKFIHFLSLLLLASITASFLDNRWLYLSVPVLIIKVMVHHYLLIQALKVKGPLFLVYSFGNTLVSSLVIVSGAVFGKVSQALR